MVMETSACSVALYWGSDELARYPAFGEHHIKHNCTRGHKTVLATGFSQQKVQSAVVPAFVAAPINRPRAAPAALNVAEL